MEEIKNNKIINYFKKDTNKRLYISKINKYADKELHHQFKDEEIIKLGAFLIKCLLNISKVNNQNAFEHK
jgi:hypothetical protein